MEKSVTILMDEIRRSLELLEANLPTRLEAMAVSPTSKLPYKVLLYREALIWRIAELGREAFDSFTKDKLVSGIVLTRAVVETTAALWYLASKVESVIDSKVVGDIDEYLMKLVVGIATGASNTVGSNVADVIQPRPMRVNTFLKHVNKDIDGFSYQYGLLSEYAHPNWSGTVLIYAKNDVEKRVSEFGQNMRQPENTKAIGVANLSVALSLFKTSYNSLSDVLPIFTTLCESQLNKNRDR